MTAVVGADPLARLATLPGVTDAVTDARASVDSVLRHRVLRRESARVTAEASLRAARASAELEGCGIGLEALRAELARDRSGPADGTNLVAVSTSAVSTSAAPGGCGAQDDRAPLVTLGAVRLYAALGTLRHTWERTPRQALARMHVLVARGLVAEADLGRPRTDHQPGAPSGPPVRRADPLDLGAAPPPSEAAARLGGLTELLLARTAAPAIIVAAVVEAELLAIRAFGEFDGIIARAASRLVLISRGLDPKALTATDLGHLEAARVRKPDRVPEADRPGIGNIVRPGPDTAHGDADDYGGAARAYVRAGTDGVRRWIIHYARAVELGARESLAICEAIARTD